MVKITNVIRLLIFCCAAFFCCQSAFAQSGLRESLERLDINENGMIDPDEVTSLSRPYLERIAKMQPREIDQSFRRPVLISKIQEAARIYYSVQNGSSGHNVRAKEEMTVKPFGPDPEQPLVPDFGLAVVKYPYVQEDLDEADSTIRRNDRNRDGYIDRKEAARSRWTHRNPFEDDVNQDGRLSRMELAQRYARRRLISSVGYELIQKARRTGGDIRPSVTEKRRQDDSMWWRKGGSNYWLTASLMGRFDSNKNGRLEANEASKLGIPIGKIDLDRDGELSREELFALVEEMQRDAGDLTEGLPGWFYEMDTNQDGQVAMSEFIVANRTDSKYEEFESLDTNNDGLLTTTEVVQSKAVVGGSYTNEVAEVLPPRRTIISEIEVEDSYLIRDLNVHLSITHSNDSFLDAYLTSPDGQRIELFTEVGGSGDHFSQTVFDDESQIPITKARPPFTGSFIPEGRLKKQPSLSKFYDTNINGVWQLVIRGTRSDRFGMLHSWGLTVTPKEEVPPVIEEEEESTSPEGEPVDEVAPGEKSSNPV